MDAGMVKQGTQPSASTDAALAHRLDYSRPLESPETLQHANCRNNALAARWHFPSNVGNLLCCP